MKIKDYRIELGCLGVVIFEYLPSYPDEVVAVRYSLSTTINDCKEVDLKATTLDDAILESRAALRDLCMAEISRLNAIINYLEPPKISA
jgi:hypothetical protein